MLKSPYQEDAFRLLLPKVNVSLLATGFDTVGADWKRELHSFRYNRMFFILDGEGCVEVEGVTYYPEPGSVVLMPTRTSQAFSSINRNGFTKYWCYFKAMLGETDLFQMYRFPVCVKMPNKARMVQLFEQLHYHFWHRRRTSPLLMRAAMFEIMSLYLDQSLGDDVPAEPNPYSETIRTVIAYIEHNLSRKISVEELAQLANYHPNYFIRYFHSVVGASPIQYIKHLRMEKAKAMLLTTALPVSEIAGHVGIQHHNFSPMFKRHTGFSPSAFRHLAGCRP